MPPGKPDTKITKVKINQKKRRARFRFIAIGTASGFQCELLKPKKKHHKKKHHKKPRAQAVEAKKHHKKPKAKFSRCRSPKTYKHLKPGRYTFKVRALNSAGIDPTPAHKAFKIRTKRAH